jgi:hypothetical protein
MSQNYNYPEILIDKSPTSNLKKICNSGADTGSQGD